MIEQIDDKFATFSQALADAAALLEDHLENTSPGELLRIQSLPSLVEQCERLCEEARQQTDQPIRTIHHLACTGGTLISKCIASMPNTHLLSEVDPLSELPCESTGRRFWPTDLIYRIGDTRLVGNTDLIIEIFIRGLSAIYEHCCNIGAHLVLRDHSHSHFCATKDCAARPSLREFVSAKFKTVSILTVRHPLDSYLSLQKNNWMHFSPPTLEEYSRRYLAFLSIYSDCPRVRYEDFVASPESTMRQVCADLDLSYAPSFVDTFRIIELSGDSGRKGAEIKFRPRREVPSSVRDELRSSARFETLCLELGYDVD
jgi:hypothetical protein